MHDALPHYLTHDQDSRFTAHADAVLGGLGTQLVSLPVWSPDLNAHAECWIRTGREECLDRIAVLKERHLGWALKQLVRDYNYRRPHRSLQLRPPDGPIDCGRDGRAARRMVHPPGSVSCLPRAARRPPCLKASTTQSTADRLAGTGHPLWKIGRAAISLRTPRPFEQVPPHRRTLLKQDHARRPSAVGRLPRLWPSEAGGSPRPLASHAVHVPVPWSSCGDRVRIRRTLNPVYPHGAAQASPVPITNASRGPST